MKRTSAFWVGLPGLKERPSQSPLPPNTFIPYFPLWTGINVRIDRNKAILKWCYAGVKEIISKRKAGNTEFSINLQSYVEMISILCSGFSTRHESASLNGAVVRTEGQSPRYSYPTSSPLWVNAMWAALINLLWLLLPPISPLLCTPGFTSSSDGRQLLQTWGVGIKDKRAVGEKHFMFNCVQSAINTVWALWAVLWCVTVPLLGYVCYTSTK